MAKRQFTEEEIAFLRRNPYTAYVDENTQRCIQENGQPCA